MSNLTYEEIMNSIKIQKYKDFLDYDKIVDLGINAMWKDLCSQIKSSDIDPTDIFANEVENLKNIEYSMKLMNVCCLSEIWEQDLYNFLKEKGLIVVLSNDYQNIKRIFEQEYPTCKISNYPQIQEMRALVNAIKHGEGNSLSNIRRITSDTILADSNFGEENSNGEIIKKKQIEFDNNTLTSRTLNVDGKLQTYCDTLVKFWEDVFEKDKEKQASAELN